MKLLGTVIKGHSCTYCMFGKTIKMFTTNFSSCFVLHQEWLCTSECLDSQHAPCLICTWWRFCSVPEACGIFID